MERNVGEEMEIGAEISYDTKEKVTKGRWWMQAGGNITREKTAGEIGIRNTKFKACGTVVGISVKKSVGIKSHFPK